MYCYITIVTIINDNHIIIIISIWMLIPMVTTCLISDMADNTSCMWQQCVSRTCYHRQTFWSGSKMGHHTDIG